VDDPARFQPPLLHLLGLGSHLLLGRRSFLFKPTPPLSMLTPLPPAPAHRRAAEVSPNLNERSLGWQGRPSRGTPTPPGYGYLTRHLPHRATHTWLSGSASRQASPSARNEEKHGIALKYLDVQAPTATMNRHRHSRCHYKWNSGSTPTGTNNPPHWRACGATKSQVARRPVREVELRLSSPSAPARMMKILEAEGGAEVAARLASPHHQNGGHRLG
jgi:hypothetical protein